jgi:hypothetical protein
MFGLLIVIAAAAIGAALAVILLVAWAVRQEDSSLTMVDPAPDRVAYAVRRLLGLHTIGVASPGQDQHTIQRGHRPAGYASPASPIGDDLGGQDPDHLPADWPGPRGPGPTRWDSMAGV